MASWRQTMCKSLSSLQALKLSQPLLATHRLDHCTEGLVVLGRSGAFVSAFNKLLQQEGAVQKYYRALTRRPPPVGVPHKVLLMLSGMWRSCRADVTSSAYLTSSQAFLQTSCPVSLLQVPWYIM